MPCCRWPEYAVCVANCQDNMLCAIHFFLPWYCWPEYAVCVANCWGNSLLLTLLLLTTKSPVHRKLSRQYAVCVANCWGNPLLLALILQTTNCFVHRKLSRQYALCVANGYGNPSLPPISSIIADHKMLSACKLYAVCVSNCLGNLLFLALSKLTINYCVRRKLPTQYAVCVANCCGYPLFFASFARLFLHSGQFSFSPFHGLMLLSFALDGNALYSTLAKGA